MCPKRIFVGLFVLIPACLSAIHHNYPQGGRSASLAGASVALADYWSVQNNQAGLAFYNRMAAGAYFENRFMVKELSLKAAGAVLPTRSGVFGFNFTYFGYPKYNESKIALSYARSFGNVFAASVQLNYLITSIGDDYGKKGVATFEAGLMSKVNENLTLAAHVFNPLMVKITDENSERIPAIIRVGAAYSIDKNILVLAEVEKDSYFDPVFKAGLEYRIIEKIFVRGGVSSNPGLYSFGFGLNLKKLTIDFSSSVHHTLGYSPQVSMIYQFK